MDQAVRKLAGNHALPGIGSIVAAWFLFALHDACIKLLVADLSVLQVLFVRSLVVWPACVMLGPPIASAAKVPRTARRGLLISALAYALAYLAYYNAARDLQLPELETVYYAAPVVTTVLAVTLLNEHVPGYRWLGLGIGFAGVLLACAPAGLHDLSAVGWALVASVLWAYSVVLIRQVSASVSTSIQMLVNNTVFLIMCGLLAPWSWVTPTAWQLVLMVFVGLAGLIGQYLLFEGIRRAPASLAAPLEYSGLLWSFALGFMIWNDVPSSAVVLGAVLVAVSGAVLIVGEWRGSPAPTDPVAEAVGDAPAQMAVTG